VYILPEMEYGVMIYSVHGEDCFFKNWSIILLRCLGTIVFKHISHFCSTDISYLFAHSPPAKSLAKK
jgi:hypothetical protein